MDSFSHPPITYSEITSLGPLPVDGPIVDGVGRTGLCFIWAGTFGCRSIVPQPWAEKSRQNEHAFIVLPFIRRLNWFIVCGGSECSQTLCAFVGSGRVAFR